MKWNEKKAQEIVSKHKSRFSLRLTFKIVRVLIAVFLIYSIYMIIVGISYEHSQTKYRTEFYQKLAVDWTYPELTSGLSVSTRASKNNITPLLTQEITFPLERRIGKRNYVVSELSLSKPLLSSLTRMEIINGYPHVSHGKDFNFNLPYDPNTGQQLSGFENNDIWNTLEMLHEGHVADLAFSTDEFYSPNELLELLSDYDVDILWMPLYMGELEQFTEGYGSGDNSLSLIPQWGLSAARMTLDDFRESYLDVVLNQATVDESQEAMLENMRTMLDNNKKLAEVLLQTNHLQERYNYLTENGFQVFGAVITGPVKELLKLQEVDTIHSVYLGKVVYWNWDGS